MQLPCSFICPLPAVLNAVIPYFKQVHSFASRACRQCAGAVAHQISHSVTIGSPVTNTASKFMHGGIQDRLHGRQSFDRVAAHHACWVAAVIELVAVHSVMRNPTGDRACLVLVRCRHALVCGLAFTLQSCPTFACPAVPNCCMPVFTS